MTDISVKALQKALDRSMELLRNSLDSGEALLRQRDEAIRAIALALALLDSDEADKAYEVLVQYVENAK